MIKAKDYISEYYPHEEGIIVFDGLDEAFIGIGFRFNIESACYDMRKIIEILVERGGMTLEEAYEYYDFNIAGAYLGDHTPIILESINIWLNELK